MGGWPLLGRDGELAALLSAVEGPAGAAVLVGEAGVGKTRLLAEVRATAEAWNWVTLSITATHSLSSIPFGAFVPALPVELVATDSRSLTDRLAQVAEVLRTRAAGRPLLVCVDDAHVLDPGSAGLVHQLALSDAIRLVVTLRAGHRPPDAVQRLCVGGRAVRIDLGGLGEETIRQIMRAHLGGDVDLLTVHRLSWLCGGNVLFLRELLDNGLRTTALTAVRGVWQWHGDLDPDARLSDVAGERLGALDVAHRDALALVAYGEPIRADTLAALVDQSIVEALADAELISAEPHGETELLRPAHPLYGELIRSWLPGIRARRLQLRLSDALRGQAVADAATHLRMVALALESGVQPDDADLAAAAARAWSLLDADLTERIAARARHPSVALHILRGKALVALGRAAEAEKLLAAQAAGPHRPTDLVRIAHVRFTALLWGMRAPEDAAAVLDSVAVGLAAPDDVALVLDRIVLHTFTGRYAAAVAEGERLRSLRVEADEFGLPSLAISLMELGRPVRAVEVLRPVEHDPETMWPEGHQRMAALVTYGFAQTQCGRFAATARIADRLEHEARRSGWPHIAAEALLLRAETALHQGRFPQAVSGLREMTGLLRTQDSYRNLPWVLASLATAEALVGEVQAATATWTEARSEFDASAGVLIRGSTVHLAEFVIRAATGDLAAARRIAAREAESCRARGEHGYALDAMHHLVRFGGRLDERDVDAVAARCDSPLSDLRARHVAALLDPAPDPLVALAETYESLQLYGTAAECLDVAADRYEQGGQRREAARAAAARDRLLAAGYGRIQPWWPSKARSDPLTPREREIAELVCAGASAAAVAAELSLSIRTVQNHLHRCYRKLGVNRRTDLAAALHRS